MTGKDIVCPNCSVEFFATPPEPQAEPSVQSAEPGFTLPAKLPFFKSSRRKLLEQRFEQLISAGSVDSSAESELVALATKLDLGPGEVSAIYKEHFLTEFKPIQQRMEATFVMTDEDVAEISKLESKYGVKADIDANVGLYRAIYLLESTGKLPPSLQTGLMLEAAEIAYFSIATVWHQSRVQSHGYAGTSISVPTGIKGVRFRFGGYSPMRSEEMTPLSSGTLYVTSSRLLFNGNSRNTSVALKKIIDGHVFSDALRIEKNTGKPDLFSMTAPYARYTLALIGALK